MATAITVAAFQTACAAVADALIANDRATAYTQMGVAEAINTGLEVAVADAGSSLRRREALTGMREALESAFAVINQQADTKRFALGRTNYNS